jgi:hypothetical protein
MAEESSLGWKAWIGVLVAIGAGVTAIQQINSLFITRHETEMLIHQAEEKDREKALIQEETTICANRFVDDLEGFGSCMAEFRRERILRLNGGSHAD